MALSHPNTLSGDRDTAYGVSVPGLPDYLKTHQVRGMPSPNDLNLVRDCTCLILYNIQSFTTAQIWHELRLCLGDMADGIKIKHVSGINRNPHADMWVRKDLGWSLLSTICDRTKIHMEGWGSSTNDKETESAPTPRDEDRSTRVQGWRLALWQPWRERRMKPSKPQPDGPVRRRPPLPVGTYNINGFWSKIMEIGELLDNEAMAVLVIQETLVTARHYPIHMNGYRSFTSHAQEDFRGIAMLVSNRLASYEVPHGLHWMIHVKVFGYAGLSDPVHFINVYLKSGGNHRRTRKEQLQVVKKIVAKIIERDNESKVVVMGDLNEPEKQLVHHLNMNVEHGKNYLIPAHYVGSRRTHFPLRGAPAQLDHILLTEKSQKLFQGAQVLRNYNSSDHRPVVMSPYADASAAERRARPTKAAFDSKMIRLKGDLLVNDNAWAKLMQDIGFAPDVVDDECKAEVSTQADAFIATFDQVCRKHEVKTVQKPGSKPDFPRHLKQLQQTVHKYSKRYHKAVDCNRAPDESTCIRLARAQKRFKMAKKSCQVRVQRQFYARVADDFVANDHKNVWSRLRAQTNPSAIVESANPVKNRHGVLQHSADRILEAMKEHYEDLLTYDPQSLSTNRDHW
ncbi:Endonuclease/exonuclease/phosphatase, partial [Lactarius pseudohatsudake]